MGRTILLVLLAVMALSVAAVRYLPWWGIALGLVGVYLAVRFGLKFVVLRVLQSLFMVPFKAKGAVLRGARAEVHSIEPAEPPATHVAEDELTVGEADPTGGAAQILVPREYYWVDVTITPRSATGPFVLWEPGELLLIRADARVGLNDLGEGSHAEDVRVVDGDRAGDGGDGKYHGPLRVKLLFGVRPGESRVYKFRYYFEAFGEVILPDATAAIANRRPTQEDRRMRDRSLPSPHPRPDG